MLHIFLTVLFTPWSPLLQIFYKCLLRQMVYDTLI